MTDWQGGVRGVAFITSPSHLPAARANTTWAGLVSQTDFYTTLLGLAGVPPATIKFGSGPLPPDSVDLWDALSSGGPSPRTEIVHNINGNYSSAIRVGRYKLLQGDPNEAGRGRSDWEKPPEAMLHGAVPVSDNKADLSIPSIPVCTTKPCLFDVLVSTLVQFSAHRFSAHSTHILMFSCVPLVVRKNKADPEERNDLHDSMPEKVTELLQRYHELAQSEVFMPDSGLCPKQWLDPDGWPGVSLPDGCLANLARGTWEPWM
jgi:hypothetical protein